MKRGIILFALILCALPCLADINGSTILLAQAENASTKFGTTASLSLQIEPGKERVFLETFPLSKVTTQASLRFAQQIACSELDIDCRGYDFFWKISGVSGIVGGPSAGASATLLASSLLLNKTLPNDIVVTGTINSGGSIGPVGGLENKIRAAAKKGMKVVFIAPGAHISNETNLSELTKSLNITVEEAPTLGYILNRVFGIKYNKTNGPIFLDTDYQERMHLIALDLCDRAKGLMNQTTPTTSRNLTKKAQEELENGNSYSAASYCFRASAILRGKIYLKKSLEERKQKAETLRDEIAQIKERLNNISLTTITNLQTYMAVMERVEDSADILKDIKNMSENSSAIKIAYAEERFFSALAWSRFFDRNGESISIDVSSLRQCCIRKIEEAHERFNYVTIVMSENLPGAKNELDQANEYLVSGNYVMCLYSASKTKALSNFMMDLIGIKKDYINSTTSLKIDIAEKAIGRSLNKGIFPIMAYSYLEYSKSLEGREELNSLLFAEEALELSNFDMYFKQPLLKPLKKGETPGSLISFIVGIILGAGIVYYILKKREN